MRIIYFISRLFITALFITVSACATQKWFYNQSVRPTEQQMFYNQDNNYCQGVAAGTVKMPNLNLSNNQSYRTYGTATIYSQSAGFVDVNYQSQTTPTGSFSSGFQDGWQISEAMSAAATRSRFADACMFKLGWREVPCQNCTPPTAGVSAQQLFERYSKQPTNKAFARGADDVAGASWGAKTEEEAKLLAIRTCAESGGKQCTIKDLNGSPQ